MDSDGKARYVVITLQVDMNLIVIKILDLDGSWCQLLTLFWRSLSGHIIFCIVFQM